MSVKKFSFFLLNMKFSFLNEVFYCFFEWGHVNAFLSLLASKATMIYAMTRITGNDS
jgi:hypothetical protein